MTEDRLLKLELDIKSMKEHSIDRLHGNVQKLTDKMENVADGLLKLIEQFKSSHEDALRQKEAMKDMDIRLRSIENKIPSLEELRDNANKIRTAITSSMFISLFIGGVLVAGALKFLG